MLQSKSPEDSGGLETHHLATATPNTAFSGSSPTTSKAAQDSVLFNSDITAQNVAEISQTSGINTIMNRPVNLQIAAKSSSEVDNEEIEKCHNLNVLAKTASQSKKAPIGKINNIPFDLNFSFNDPRFLEYFANQVGPMYSATNQSGNQSQSKFWYQQEISPQSTQIPTLYNQIPSIKLNNNQTFQNSSHNTPIVNTQNVSTNFSANISTEQNTSINYPMFVPQNMPYVFSKSIYNEQNPIINSSISAPQNTPIPFSQNVFNMHNQIMHPLNFTPQSMPTAFPQHVFNGQNSNMQPQIHKQQNMPIQFKKNHSNASDANLIINPPFLTIPYNSSNYSHDNLNLNQNRPPFSHITTNTIQQTSKSLAVPEISPHKNNKTSEQYHILSNPNNNYKNKQSSKKCEKPSNTVNVNEVKNNKHLENLKGHPLLRHTINSPIKNYTNQLKPTFTQKDKSKKNLKRKRNKHYFEDYLSDAEVERGLKENRLFEGILRINPKRFDQAYVTINRDEQDIFINGLKKRNRALDGDIVILEIVEKDKQSPRKDVVGNKESHQEHKSDSNDSDDEEYDETELKEEENKMDDVNKDNSKNNREGKVVFIKEKIHPRTCTGYLRLMPDNNKLRALFIPRDIRIPRINVLATSWPDNFYEEAKAYENVIFLVKIVEWLDLRFAMGTIIRNVGEAGNLYAEMIAILSENYLDVTPFGPEVNAFFPRPDFVIPDEEITKREDCRNQCIFSIDPSNCRDVDDAMSCRPLGNGKYEIGVHISDVSYYLKENTILDEQVADKATTVYMVERAFHMLPDELCLLCSLFSGVDKLAFSVFWEITADGMVLSHRFARTVINSCAQMSYEHAQAILDDAEVTNFPVIYNGFSYEDIKSGIKMLGKLSSIFKMRRFESGAMSIYQPKLNFHLNPENGLPESFHIHQSRPSHQLIEEFMLLANITVAERIYKDYPKLAFLRRHPEPSKFQLMDLVKQLKAVDIDLDISSSGSLYKSLLPYIGPDCENEEKAVVISMMCTKPMTRAMYFCAAGQDDDDFKHYALNVPLYTHFTSPIRRYADIMVHRLLSASIKYRDTPTWDIDRVQMIAANCNKQKYNAKRAGEKSTELYTLKYIEINSPVMTNAVVVEVREKSFDVIVLAMNLNRRIYIDNINGIESTFYRSKTGNKLSKLDIVWPASDASPETKLTIQLFSIIQIEMVKGDDILKVETRLMRPL